MATVAQEEYEELCALEKELEEMRSSTVESESLNEELRREVGRLEERLDNCKEDVAGDRHSNGIVKTHLAMLQTRLIASLSHIVIPTITVKMSFDTMDDYVSQLEQIIMENSIDNKGVIAEIKESLSDFKY